MVKGSRNLRNPLRLLVVATLLCPPRGAVSQASPPKDPVRDLVVELRVVEASAGAAELIVRLTNASTVNYQYEYVVVVDQTERETLPHNFVLLNQVSGVVIRTPRPSPYVFLKPAERERGALREGQPILPGESLEFPLRVDLEAIGLVPSEYRLEVEVWVPPGVPLQSNAIQLGARVSSGSASRSG